MGFIPCSESNFILDEHGPQVEIKCRSICTCECTLYINMPIWFKKAIMNASMPKNVLVLPCGKRTVLCSRLWLIALAHGVVEVVSRVGKFNSSAHMTFEGLLVSERTPKHLPNHCLQQRRCLDDFHQTLCRRGGNNMVYESVAWHFIAIHFFRISNINWKDCKYKILHFSGTSFCISKVCRKPNWIWASALTLHPQHLLCCCNRGLRARGAPLIRFELISVQSFFQRAALLFHEICFWKLSNGSLLVWRAEWNINVQFILAQSNNVNVVVIAQYCFETECMEKRANKLFNEMETVSFRILGLSSLL